MISDTTLTLAIKGYVVLFISLELLFIYFCRMNTNNTIHRDPKGSKNKVTDILLILTLDQRDIIREVLGRNIQESTKVLRKELLPLGIIQVSFS